MREITPQALLPLSSIDLSAQSRLSLVLDTIQHFVAIARLASIHCSEQTLNRRESAIRRRFVPSLFHAPAKHRERPRISSCPLPLHASMGICCLPDVSGER
jgi:hypothetical protein